MESDIGKNLDVKDSRDSIAIPTEFTRLVGCRFPIIGAPMFLVSNVAMVVSVSEAGGLGCFPALNFRPLKTYKKALTEIRSQTKKPFGVNIIVNKSNSRQQDDLRVALDCGVPFFITSLGSPKPVIEEAHRNGAKVFCDVTNLAHALKVQDMGADGVIAVGAGAGGHAGPLSPLVLIPWLTKELQIPVVAAGGIANGRTMASALALGAQAVSVGTRFIASIEADVDEAYKTAIVKSSPEDIVLTKRISGTPASVINTPYVQQVGTELPWTLRVLQSQTKMKKWVVPLIHYLGMRSLQKAAQAPTWKTVWSAGQSVGLVSEVASCKQIVENMVSEYIATVRSLPVRSVGSKDEACKTNEV